jgi:TPR repeat protein
MAFDNERWDVQHAQDTVEVELTYCGDNSGWACNELGGHYLAGEIVSGDPERALAYFTRACDLRFQAGCVNLLDPATFIRSAPKPLDLRLLLREGGLNLIEMSEGDLYVRACDHSWSFACERTAVSS